MPSREILALAYRTISVPLDKLPYTPEFDALVRLIRSMSVSSDEATPSSIWLALVGLRKRGWLPRLRR